MIITESPAPNTTGSSLFLDYISTRGCRCPVYSVCNCGSVLLPWPQLTPNQQARRKAWLRGHRERRCR